METHSGSSYSQTCLRVVYKISLFLCSKLPAMGPLILSKAIPRASLIVQQSRIHQQCRRCGSIPGLGRFPGGGHGNALQYSWLENPMDRGDWRATVHGAAKSGTQLKRLSTHAQKHLLKDWKTMSNSNNSNTKLACTDAYPVLSQFSRSVVSDSLQPHESQHTRPPCPSPTPRVYSTRACWVGDAIQPSHPLSSPSLPTFNLS